MSLKTALNQGLGVLGSSIVSVVGYMEGVNWVAIASALLSLVLTSVIIYKTIQEAKITRLEAKMKELEYEKQLEKHNDDQDN